MSIVQNIVWRNGLSGTSGAERLAILGAEHAARQRAIQEWYLERLDESSDFVVDAHDLDVRGASTFWGRKGGSLYLRITVYGRSAGRIRTFLWRSTVRGTSPKKHPKIVRASVDSSS